jgi:hypothetical protein
VTGPGRDDVLRPGSAPGSVGLPTPSRGSREGAVGAPAFVPGTRRQSSRGRARTVVVAGTAGGVGTTTVAALVWDAVVRRGGTPGASDHTEGSLAARLPAAASEAPSRGPSVTLHDLGAHATGPGDVFRENSAVLVTPASPAGLEAVRRVLRRLADLGDAGGPTAVVVVVTEPYGRPRADAVVRAVTGEHPTVSVVRLAADPALAGWGALRPAALMPSTRQSAEAIADRLGL